VGRRPGAASTGSGGARTTDPQWRYSRSAGAATSLVLPGVNIDDWFFGVQSISADGFASPIVFPGVAGSFISPPPSPAPAS
jgi:hypothetical protein